MPVAASCRVVPLAMLGVNGVIAIEVSVAEFTVKVVLPEIAPDVAVMVDVPVVALVVMPAAFTVAIDVVPEVQVTDALMSCVDPSEYVPVAVSCLVAALGIDGLAGVMEIAVSVAAVTVSVVLPEIVPDVAVMVEVPIATPVARPLVLVVATDAVLEDQDTIALISFDDPSE